MKTMPTDEEQVNKDNRGDFSSTAYKQNFIFEKYIWVLIFIYIV